MNTSVMWLLILISIIGAATSKVFLDTYNEYTSCMNLTHLNLTTSNGDPLAPINLHLSNPNTTTKEYYCSHTFFTGIFQRNPRLVNTIGIGLAFTDLIFSIALLSRIIKKIKMI